MSKNIIAKLNERLDTVPSPPKFIIVTLAVVIILAIALTWFYARKARRTEWLYSQLVGADIQGSEQANRAMRELAASTDRQSTDLLLEIAENKVPVALGDTQLQAIRALRGRKDPRLGAAVAALLQPHESWGVRLASAEALQDLSCDTLCVRFVLHYLERLWRGEKNVEEFWNPPPPLDKERQRIHDLLLAVIHRESSETAGVLHDTYGLGSDAPTAFAIAVAAEARLKEACPLLLSSSTILRQTGPKYLQAPRDDLHTAIGTLKCDFNAGGSR